MLKPKTLLPLLAIVIVGTSILLLWPEPEPPKTRKPVEMIPAAGQQASWFLPTIVDKEGFVSSDTCKECHEGNYDSWHKTYHRTMTQVATPESVVAPFDGVVLEGYGHTYRLFREGDEFWAEMPDPDMERELSEQGWNIRERVVGHSVPIVKRRIVMTTGSHHMQGYWVPSKKGLELLQFPWIYSIEQQRWLPTDDVFIRPPDTPRRIAVWNTSCIQCHSVDGNPKAWGSEGELFSEVAELGIACGACHGPGRDHIERHRTAAASGTTVDPNDDPIVNPGNCSAEVSSQVCGQCHSAFQAKDVDDWWKHGYGYTAGEPLDRYKEIFHQGNETMRELSPVVAQAAFWPDGTMRVGGREYIALLQSPCFNHDDENRKMSCNSCHSMHEYDEPSDQLRPMAKGNDACLQCHDQYADDLTAHTHHAIDSPGSLCYNCHMPHTSYALLKGIRSHRVVSPDIRESIDGMPNGCNQCHLDKTLSWTATHLKDWYDVTVPRNIPPDHQQISASLIWLLRGDAAQRAVTAWTMGWDAAHQASGDGWQAPFLAPLLDDPYPAIRYMAYAALKTLPGFESLEFDFIGPRNERTRTADEVFTQWSKQPKELPEPSESVLVDQEGKLMGAILAELLEQRDDRPILFPE